MASCTLRPARTARAARAAGEAGTGKAAAARGRFFGRTFEGFFDGRTRRGGFEAFLTRFAPRRTVFMPSSYQPPEGVAESETQRGQSSQSFAFNR